MNYPGLKWVFWGQNRGKNGATLTPTNSFLARRCIQVRNIRHAASVCRSVGVSSGHTRGWIWTPFGVVSGVWLGSGVLDFGGDRRRGRGSLGEFNAEMAY